MPTLTPGILKSQSALRLRDTNSSRLVLIHTGALLSLSILASAINLFLNDQISTTGGLGGLQARSILQSLQAFLQYGTTLFSPFWQAGFTLAMLHTASGAAASGKDLLGGFRRWTAVLSLQLFTMVIYFGAAISCGYLAATVFALTPFSDSLADILEPMLASGTLDLTTLPAEALLDAYIPMLVIFLAFLLPLALYFTLSLRLSEYLILDHKMGGFAAVHFSMAAMRGNRIKMLKLDLSFWWYYLIEVLLSIVCYLDLLLPLLGVTLPFNETIAFFAALLLYAGLELAFHLWKKPYHDVTYALAYQEILHSLETPKQSN